MSLRRCYVPYLMQEMTVITHPPCRPDPLFKLFKRCQMRVGCMNMSETRLLHGADGSCSALWWVQSASRMIGAVLSTIADMSSKVHKTSG